MKSRHIQFTATTIAALTALAVAAPVVSILLLALQPVPELWPHLVAYVLPQALGDTALLLLGVGIVTLGIGAGSAWLISTHNFAGRRLLIWLMPMPLAIPTYLAAYVYVDLFEPLGLVHQALATAMPTADAIRWLPNLRSLPGAIFVIGLVLYPYVYLSARAMFQHRSADFAEAAKVLGAGRWTTFRRVSLPMARPALAVGVALVSLETLNDIGASEYLGVRTLTVSVFTTWLNRGSLPGAAQLSLLMLAIVALLIAVERIGRNQVSVEFSAENPRLAPRKPLHGIRAALAFAACMTPALLGFAVPLLYLLRETLRRELWSGAGSVWRDAGHSIVLAGTATAIALLLGLTVIVARRWRASGLADLSLAVAQAGYAVPGLVLALGLLTPLLAIDGAFNAVAAWLGMVPPGLIMIGSGAAVVTAYVIRFLAVPTGFIKAGFERIPVDYDDSARSAGAPDLTTLRRIHLPLLRPALLGAVIVVFVDGLKELPATLLLRPLNVETLATSIYQYASRGSFEEGALAALLIVAASIPPVMWLTRFADVPQGPA
ncbi:iron ABC transporter permease [Tardiphaga sp. vice352]|uniref:ABC transporter permease n=1 Tax=unclassified Tardiphaga TaxID=2631404 RepID=UPI0011653D6E|nr:MULTISPECIES: iron ABC transporter permease [unclassified Tardiphaga]QDM23593.1 iron ABC transporter permease [Tardiphaga sp. vice154]QDM28818.1 iron ABC transporter permease [Tardiphaga sp. vice304]QDM33917.1 iron ABC transporter permease [Tardiphaga sp. vice352]